MAKKQQPAPKEDKWLSVAVLCSLALSMACTTYLIVDRFKTHELICSVKAVDQISGLVVLDCAK